MNEIAAVFGISAALNETDRENVVAKIEAQEELCNNLLESPHIKPFSEFWCWLVNLRQMVSYRLDCLCGIE
ncbi:MAG TPA: hypothetical protein IAA21_13475 [Candidatus Blautia faecigallinarum]|uniref:Uncharacterized protein n=1 Tax=Candidatus Blautia faecigallinarum TaxID=2838488 RepID=A0A9D2IUJ5_9FIRM|nr:hypothetical protein [Candidatus Blautia faecigallinarum]